jgi:hypothetical protein
LFSHCLCSTRLPATTSGGSPADVGEIGPSSRGGASKAMAAGWKGFIAGPERLHDDESPINARQVFIGRAGGSAAAGAAAGAFAVDDSLEDDGTDEGSEASGGDPGAPAGGAGAARPAAAGADAGADREEYRLVVYRHGRVTVAFLVEPALAGDTAFYRELRASIEPAVANLAAVIEGKSARVGPAAAGGGAGQGGSSGGGGIGDSYRYL